MALSREYYAKQFDLSSTSDFGGQRVKCQILLKTNQSWHSNLDKQLFVIGT